MKVTDCDLIVTAPPAPGWGGRYWLLVKLTTCNGIVGWGECYASSVGPGAMGSVITDVFARHVAGESPFNLELMARRVYSSGFTQRPDLTVMGAWSGIEIAIWDILGKALEQPVYNLIGGRTQERVRLYSYLYPLPHHDTTAFWSSPEMAAEASLDLVERGYSAVKFDPAGPYTIRGGHQPSLYDLELSVTTCRAVREAVGPRADLLFGTHGQLNSAGALRLSEAIKGFDPAWFEEPVPPDDLTGLARVAVGSPIPIATGERLTGVMEFAAVLEAGAQILQPALGRAGGISEARKIAALAQANGAQMAPHLYAGPVEWAANLHLATAIPNLLLAETIETPFHFDLIKDTLKPEGGYIRLGEAPGLGIEVDEDLARRHGFDGDGLHLQMQEDPVSYHGPNAFSGGAPPKD